MRGGPLRIAQHQPSVDLLCVCFTPPVGFNLFVIQGLTDDGLGYIARVTLPYLIIMVGFVLLLTLFPGIVTILPRLLYG